MATMQDVARLAKVSLSTVSYALSGDRPVSDATKARIETAMAELGFQRNAMARGLASRRSHILALTLPMPETGLSGTASEFVMGAAQAARGAGYHLVLWPLPVDSGGEVAALSGQRLADGVVVMEVCMDDARVAALAEVGVPFALIGRTGSVQSAPAVDIDFEHTAEDAVAQLTALGHRRIALVNHSPATRAAGYGPTLRIAEGFETAMRDRGLDPVVLDCEESASAGRAAVRTLLDRVPGLTAVVVMNEEATFGIVPGLHEAGLSVPADVSVLSIVSTPRVAAMTTPVLATLRAPGTDLGRLAVEALVRLTERGDAGAGEVLLPCHLVPGESLGPAPTS